jgi:hypothetical protein
MIVESCDVTRGIILGMIRTGQCGPPVPGLGHYFGPKFCGRVAWEGDSKAGQKSVRIGLGLIHLFLSWVKLRGIEVD